MAQDETIGSLAKQLADHIDAERGELAHISAQLSELKALQQSFPIAPKEHYDDHKKLKEIAEAYDKVANRIGSVVISIVVAGGLGVASIIAFFQHKP